MEAPRVRTCRWQVSPSRVHPWELFKPRPRAEMTQASWLEVEPRVPGS